MQTYACFRFDGRDYADLTGVMTAAEAVAAKSKRPWSLNILGTIAVGRIGAGAVVVLGRAVGTGVGKVEFEGIQPGDVEEESGG